MGAIAADQNDRHLARRLSQQADSALPTLQPAKTVTINHHKTIVTRRFDDGIQCRVQLILTLDDAAKPSQTMRNSLIVALCANQQNMQTKPNR